MSHLETPNPTMVLRELRRELGRLTAIVDSALNTQDVTNVDVGLPVFRTDAIVEVLRRLGTPLTPVQIWRELRALDRDDPKMEVQVTTYDLWRRGRLAKVGRGLYCHPAYVPPDATTLHWDETSS